MNKGELIDAIAIKANVTKKDADTILNATLETIVETIALGEKLVRRGEISRDLRRQNVSGKKQCH